MALRGRCDGLCGLAGFFVVDGEEAERCEYEGEDAAGGGSEGEDGDAIVIGGEGHADGF